MEKLNEIILDIFTEELTIAKQGAIDAFRKNNGYKPLFDLFCHTENSYLHLFILKTVYTLAWANEDFLKDLTHVILNLLPTIIQMFPKSNISNNESNSNVSNGSQNSGEAHQYQSNSIIISFSDSISPKEIELNDITLSEDQKIALRKFLAPSLIGDIFHLISDPFKFTPSFIPLLAFITFIYKGTSDKLDAQLAENWDVLGDLMTEPNVAATLTEVPYWVYWLMILCQASFKTDDDIAPMIGYVIAIILNGSCRKGNEKPLCELFSSLNSISTLHNVDSTQTKIKVLKQVFKDWPNSALNSLYMISFSALFIHLFTNNDQIIINNPIFDIKILEQMEQNKNNLAPSSPIPIVKSHSVTKAFRKLSDVFQAPTIDLTTNLSEHPISGFIRSSTSLIPPDSRPAIRNSNSNNSIDYNNNYNNNLNNLGNNNNGNNKNNNEQIVEFAFKVRTTETNVWRDSELAMVLVDGILTKDIDHINEHLTFSQYLSIPKVVMGAYVLSILILTKSITSDINEKIDLLIKALLKADQFDAHTAAALILEIPI